MSNNATDPTDPDAPPPTAPGPNGANGADPAAAALPEDVTGHIAALEVLIEGLKKEKLLALAEAENASKRADKRIADNAKYAVSNIAKSLLAVADNLGRALLAAPAEQRASNDTLRNLATGIELTAKELETVFENQGMRRMNALNQPFDANFHNAIQEVENTSVPAGTIVQVFQDGYMMHDRLLRPAMVVIARGGPKRESTGGANGASGVNTTI